LENFPKKSPRKKVTKLPRFFGGFGQIFSVLPLKSPYLGNRL
jgi:hypothetical protein